jgi:hypothetical protein
MSMVGFCWFSQRLGTSRACCVCHGPVPFLCVWEAWVCQRRGWILSAFVAPRACVGYVLLIVTDIARQQFVCA